MKYKLIVAVMLALMIADPDIDWIDGLFDLDWEWGRTELTAVSICMPITDKITQQRYWSLIIYTLFQSEPMSGCECKMLHVLWAPVASANLVKTEAIDCRKKICPK